MRPGSHTSPGEDAWGNSLHNGETCWMERCKRSLANCDSRNSPERTRRQNRSGILRRWVTDGQHTSKSNKPRVNGKRGRKKKSRNSGSGRRKASRPQNGRAAEGPRVRTIEHRQYWRQSLPIGMAIRRKTEPGGGNVSWMGRSGKTHHNVVQRKGKNRSNTTSVEKLGRKQRGKSFPNSWHRGRKDEGAEEGKGNTTGKQQKERQC